jgi:hypothetical protein
MQVELVKEVFLEVRFDVGLSEEMDLRGSRAEWTM